ncbi:MAG: hypothetical protein ACE5I7_01875 [Candidatus Binatia bacterium]
MNEAGTLVDRTQHMGNMHPSTNVFFPSESEVLVGAPPARSPFFKLSMSHISSLWTRDGHNGDGFLIVEVESVERRRCAV